MVLCGGGGCHDKILGLNLARHWHDLMVQHRGYLCRDCIILGWAPRWVYLFIGRCRMLWRGRGVANVYAMLLWCALLFGY